MSVERPGVQVGPETRLELRRLANLFLISSVTLALFLAWVFSQALRVTFPRPVTLVWGAVLLVGLATTYVSAAFTTLRARRLGWLVVCLIPGLGLPCAVAYAWVRRMEIEREVLGEDRTPARQRRGGRRR
jgi:hypothetical protein